MDYPEKILKERHFLEFRDWAEICLTSPPDSDSYCYRCNRPLIPLSWLDPEYYLIPCWSCVGRRKAERQVMTENIIRSIHDFYYSKVLGDRYFQLFIVDPIYFSNTLPHDYTVFKKIISKLSPPSRNDIWFLDWNPGYPKVITPDNLPGLKIVNLSSLYPEVVIEKDMLKVGEFNILLPEQVSYDAKHQSRYSVLNQRGDRKAKRIKIGDKCYRFYNTGNDNVKSLFRLVKDGVEVPVASLTHQDYAIIKLALMRNKSYLRLWFDVVMELVKSVSEVRDSVILKNTVTVNPKKSGVLNLVWNSKSPEVRDGYINISIL